METYKIKQQTYLDKIFYFFYYLHHYIPNYKRTKIALNANSVDI